MSSDEDDWGEQQGHGPEEEEDEWREQLLCLNGNDPLCTELRVVVRAMGPNGARQLAEGLKTNTALTSLYIERSICDDRDTPFGDEGVTYLAASLEHNQSLRKLILTGHTIGDSGAQKLAEALLRNKALRSLNLATNHIRIGGIRTLASTLEHNLTLTELVLARNQMRDHEAQVISGLLEKKSCALTSMNLGANFIGPAGATSLALALRRNETLKSLLLHENNFGDLGTSAMAEMLW
jgi:Ran GTPase-activating protein (RanGAP) involved in mRNA processing and transport